MLESTGEIATKHIVIGTIIGIYLLGVFAIRFWCGVCTRTNYKMDDMESLIIMFWPIMIPMICVEMFVDFCSWASRKIPFLKTAWSFIVRVLDIATLTFRPFTLGKRVAQWRQRQQGKLK